MSVATEKKNVITSSTDYELKRIYAILNVRTQLEVLDRLSLSGMIQKEDYENQLLDIAEAVGFKLEKGEESEDGRSKTGGKSETELS